MKYYEVWRGDEYLGVYSGDDLNYLAEGDPLIRWMCISD